MKRNSIYYVLILVGLLSISCQKDEEVIVPTAAEQIAEKILTINPQSVSIHSYSNSYTDFDDVSYEIEIPFIVVESKSDNGKHYYFLEKVIDMWYIKSMNCLVLSFE